VPRGHRGVVDGALLLVAIVWGTSYLTAKSLVTTETVLAVLALRFAIAAAGVALFTGLRLTAREVRVGAILGLILSVVFVLETFGVTGTSATNAGLIISLTLVITPLVDRGSVPRRFYGAALLAVVGVALLTQGQGFSSPSLGDVLMLLAAIARAVHVTAMHRLSAGEPVDSRSLTLVQLGTVALAFLVASAFIGDGVVTTIGGLTAEGWAQLAYLALACTVLAFCVQMWAVRRTSPARVGLLLGTEPVWAAAVGIALAGDQLTVVSGAGAALILVATMYGRRIEEGARTAASDVGTRRATADGAIRARALPCAVPAGPGAREA
jgi:drug/metabolite transporter (DMT)-like permease